MPRYHLRIQPPFRFGAELAMGKKRSPVRNAVAPEAANVVTAVEQGVQLAHIAKVPGQSIAQTALAVGFRNTPPLSMTQRRNAR